MKEIIDFDEPIIVFFIYYLAIMGLCTYIVYYVSKVLRKKYFKIVDNKEEREYIT
ncbi:hypothetical protein [Clostridium sp. Marseille-P299]|uniref:hypothetical protein n=1 Tax=Clostridium sp. Marseille-P299 TaxID=1805477 RepID=UPI000AA42A4A|nr:hypothetical protein [Clostridium sp. Marseille-P299]